MGRKIMILCGSPRPQGNTNTLVDWLAEGAAAGGATVDRVNTAQMKFKTNGCIACMACQKSDEFGCVIDDDAKAVFARMPDADVIVFATPVYFCGPSAQLKLLLDRMFSMVKIHTPGGELRHAFGETDFALVATSGGKMEEGLGLTEQMFQMVSGFHGRPLRTLLLPGAPDPPGDLASNTAMRDEAVRLGRQLAAG